MQKRVPEARQCAEGAAVDRFARRVGGGAVAWGQLWLRPAGRGRWHVGGGDRQVGVAGAVLAVPAPGPAPPPLPPPAWGPALSQGRHQGPGAGQGPHGHR